MIGGRTAAALQHPRSRLTFHGPTPYGSRRIADARCAHEVPALAVIV